MVINLKQTAKFVEKLNFFDERDDVDDNSFTIDSFPYGIDILIHSGKSPFYSNDIILDKEQGETAIYDFDRFFKAAYVCFATDKLGFNLMIQPTVEFIKDTVSKINNMDETQLVLESGRDPLKVNEFLKLIKEETDISTEKLNDFLKDIIY